MALNSLELSEKKSIQIDDFIYNEHFDIDYSSENSLVKYATDCMNMDICLKRIVNLHTIYY